MKDEKEKDKEKAKVDDVATKQAKPNCMYCPYCMNQICPMSDVEYQVNEMYPTWNAGAQYQVNEMYTARPNMQNWWSNNPYDYKYYNAGWSKNQYAPYAPSCMQDNMMLEQYKNPNTQRMMSNTSYGCCCNPYGLGRY